MKVVMNIVTFTILLRSTSAFTIPVPGSVVSSTGTYHRTALNGLLGDSENLEEEFDRELAYSAGTANTEFAKRFGNRSGSKIRTVGEAFAEFTTILGHPINAIYRSMITDIVGSTHLTTVDARFKRDPVWCLGIITTMELLLKNYPEQDIAADIISALFKSLGMEEAEVRTEAKSVLDWAEGKTQADVTEELKGEGDSFISLLAKDIKADEFWMNSRYFAIGLVKVMEKVGVEQNKETAFTVMEEWVGSSLGKRYFSACSDSDLYFTSKDKLDMMETLMKEIEIREKKRMADRLEEKAEAALLRAEKDAEMNALESEDAEKAVAAQDS